MKQNTTSNKKECEGMNESQMRIEEDEIDLRELFKTIMNHKVMIMVITAVVTLGSIVYVLNVTPIYQAKALVEIGNYKLNNNNNNNNNNNKALVDNPSQLVKKLNVLYIDLLKNDKDRKAYIESIEVPKNSKEFIEIKALGTSNKLASNQIDIVVKYMQDKHKEIMDDVKLRREMEIKNISTNIQTIKTRVAPLLSQKIKLQEKTLAEFNHQLKTIDKNIKEIQNNNPTLAALQLMQKRDLMNFTIKLNSQLMDMKDKLDNQITIDISKLKEKKLLFESLLLPYNYKNTHIVGKIMLNDYPIKPKKRLIVIVAFVTSFILSIFIVFFMEFLRSFKDEEQ